MSTKQRWKDEELETLEGMGDLYRLDDIVKRLNALQSKNGWQVRTRKSIYARLLRLGYRAYPGLDGFSMVAISNHLGVHRTIVKRWVVKFGLPARIYKSNWEFKISSFRKWAYAHPELLAGIDAERLNWLMEDTEFCESLELRRKCAGKQPVVRVEDGAVFSTIKEAAKQANVDPSAIWQAVNKDYCCAGYRWRYLSESAA